MKSPAAGSEAEALHDALRALRESELRFRAAIDATADGIHVVDVDTMRFIDVNETACRTLGYTRDEFLQLAIPDIAPDADLQRLAGLYERLFNGEDNEQSAEIVHCRRDGTRIPIEIRRRGVILGGRRVAVNVVRDITANKRTEAMIRRHALQQSLIAAFGQRALATSDLDELMTRAATLICEGLEVGCARVVQLAEDERSLMLKAAVGWPDAATGAPVPDGERRLRPLLASSAPAFISAEGEVPCDGGPPIASGVEVAIAGARGACGVLGAYAGADRVFTQRSADFLQNLANTLATAMDRIGAEQRLAYLAQFDALTGLPNRTLFLDRFAQTLVLGQRNDWQTGVLFIDLDRFKAINDTLGHAAGDRLLVQVAQRLQDCVRSGDTVGRLSGDEFAAALPGLARADDAALVAQKVVAALSRPFKLAGRDVVVSASVGIAIHPLDGHDPDGLLKNADTAMYRAKAHGRNGYQFFLPQMNERAVERLQLETQLRGALERGEFSLHCTPRCDATGEITACEASLQWLHPVRGAMPAHEVAPLLEDTGLAGPVGAWLVREACAELAKWQAAGMPLRVLAIRLSPRQLVRAELDTVVAGALADAGVEARWLEIGITEGLLAHDAQELRPRLAALKALGVRLVLVEFACDLVPRPA